jgi:fructose-1,6-bisphosphatase II
MFTTHVHYMQKLVVGRKARGVIDLEMPVEWNLRRIAKAEGLPVQELTVVVLDRDRNKEVIAQIREVGARIKLISATASLARSRRRWRRVLGSTA